MPAPPGHPLIIAPTPTSTSPLAPLRIPLFRALWIAAIVGDVGGWMQTVGAQWLLIGRADSTLLVALVSAAAAVPFLILGLPAGVIAEFLDRRRVLIAVQFFQVGVGTVLFVLTMLDSMTPALLLSLTFMIGAGDVLQIPAYQALVPDLVPRPMIPASASASAIGVNIARAIGPALAGIAISQFGIGFVFALNVLSSSVFLVVLLRWRGYKSPTHQPEPFSDATRAGVRYVINSAVVRNLFIRLAVFIVPANALWALLPLIASDRLSLGSDGYGLLLAALGLGSISGAFLLPVIRKVIGLSATVAFGTAVFGLGSMSVALSTSFVVTTVVLVVTGIAWIAVVVSLSGAVQAFLPAWVRARGLSTYQMIFFGGTAAGAAVAGAIAQATGTPAVDLTAGGILLLVAASYLLWPLARSENADRSEALLPITQPLGILDGQMTDIDDASTLVLARWEVPFERHVEFRDQMELVEASRRRTGARHWELYIDRNSADSFIEVFDVGSWREHLQQHRIRLTGYDRALLNAAALLATGAPTVTHLLATQE
ncbi:hypothetical protein AX769_21395 (plasmid) [Frondihabitans sp. PAMC 28766]|uniref:MFS transporter n=1 Tax=Frondihabitans sp. PAMC 28766 TaxID=1795630 RepID=UPI00078EE3A6|nr:MFS transporter [Frondihabitans sp. PAMC 28766]AMM22683.1 hypothetical protein AX769_21395 [Frondihabitans sp. PAMC 28766]